MLYYPTGQSLPSGVNCDGFDLIQLAATRDLRQWSRLGERGTFIGPSLLSEGLAGNYDRLQLQVTNQPVDRGDQLWFYYEGMKRRVPQHDRWTDGSPRDPATLSAAERADWLEDTHTAVYVGVLRKDGFVSLDGGAEGGWLLSRPLRWCGTSLLLNLAAAAGGQARVELLDGEGRPLPGFSGGDSAVVEGDGIGLRVDWGRDLAPLDGQVVRLRIHLRAARLYAFWTE